VEGELRVEDRDGLHPVARLLAEIREIADERRGGGIGKGLEPLEELALTDRVDRKHAGHEVK
jgi:hypothetical protein